MTERPDYVTSREAVAILAVRMPTLYAYVARGLVRSIPSASNRGRLYSRADLERVKARARARAGHEAAAVDALHWGQPVLDSALTRIDARGPAYRGRLAADLAATEVAFEAVAEFLWRGESVEAEPWAVTELGYRPNRLAVNDRRGAYFRRLMLAIPMLAAADRDATQPLSIRDECRRALSLLVRLRAALSGSDRTRAHAARTAPSMALGVAAALGARSDRLAETCINRCLVVCADHELNASTFAARVAASAGCDLYACLAAALAVLSGTRHGGATDAVEAMLGTIESPAAARAFVDELCRRREAIPGFGHPLYPTGDPRAVVLLDTIRGRASAGATASVFAVVDAVHEACGQRPNVDFALVAVARSLALPPGAATALFAIGRAAGWIAHVLEQRETGVLLRPRARYVGPP